MAIFFFLLLFGLSSASYLPNGCPEDPHIHLLLPHETDCTKFYYCVHGEKHLRQCSGGLYFDPVYQVCNWPQNVDCQPTHVTTESVTTTENEVATTEKTTDTTTNYLTTTESSVTTDRNEESTEIITPEQPTAEPTTKESTTVEPTTEESTTVEPTTKESTTVEPTTENPTTVEPTTEESTTEQSTTVEPTTEESTTVEPTTAEPSTEESTTVEPTTEESTTVEPTTENPTTVEPTTEESTTEQSTTVEPTTEESPTEEPTTVEPTTATTEMTIDSEGTTIEVSTVTEPTTNESESSNESRDVESSREPALTTERTVPTTEQQPETPAICPPGFIGNVPHPERCDSYFLCSGWEPIQLFCAPGLEFDAALQICVAIAEGGCNWQNGQLTSTTTHPSTDEESTTTITEEETTKEPATELTTETTVPTTEQQPETPNICPPGFVGNVPHPERCDSYFLCSGWEPIQLFCAPGLEFDATLQICVAIAEGGCNWQNGQLTSTSTHPSTDEESTTTDEQTVPTTETPTTSEAPMTELTTETTPLTTEQQPETPAICPPGFIGNVPHPERCDSYFLCSGWEPIQLFCAPGLEFDAALQICVAISEGGCNWQNGQLTSTTTHTTTEQESTTTTTEDQTVPTTETTTASEAPVTGLTTETTLSTTEQQPESPDICPPGFIGNVPHPERCDSYFLCSGWEPIQLFCAPGLEFDAALQICVAIAEGGCNWQNGQLTSTTIHPSTDEESTTRTTEEQTVSTTESQTTSEAPVTDLTTETTLSTTEGPTTITTDVPTTVTIEEQTLSTTESQITTDEPATELTTEDTESTTEKQPETPAICPPGFIGNVPHPERCDSYFLCSGWEPIQLFCAPGLEFDAALQTCVAIVEGGCNWQNGQLTSTTAEPSTDGDLTTTEFTSEVSTTTDEQTVSTTESQTATEVSVTETTITTITEDLTTTTEEPETITTTTKDTTITTEESTTITDEQTATNTDSVGTSTELSTEKTVTTTEQQPETPAVCPPGFIGNVPHPERCDSYFLCSGWEPIQLFCAPGLEFDAALQICVVIAEGGCNWQNGQLTSTPTHPSTDEESTKTTEGLTIITTDDETTTEEPTTELTTEKTVTTTEQQPETPAICPPEFIGNVPHPERCDSYFLCSGWEPIQLFCAPGLEFDATLQTCVAIVEGGCNWQNGQLTSTTAEPSTDGDLTTTEFTSEVSTITTDEQTVATTESQPATEESVTETTDDITTVTKDLTTTTEEPGTITTTTKDTTITTEESTTTITDKQTESTTESVETSTELSTETTVTTTEQQPETPAICPPGFVGNVPHPERCDSYFLCSGWEPIQLFCAPGLEFDAALQTCVAIAEGGCNWQNGQLTSTTAEPSTDGDLTTTEFTSEVSTTTDEQTVSTTESQTATEVLVTETTITTITEDLTTTTEKPGTITTTTKDTTITTEESTTITNEQTESTTEFVVTSTELSTEKTVTTTEQQPETPAICPPGFVGNVPHPERCDSYFLCSGWEPIQLFCAPGLEFDMALQTCVAIAEGGCNWQNGQLTSTTAEPSTDGDLTTTEFTSEVSTTTDEQTVSTTESQTATEVTVTETTEGTTDDITTITENLTTTTEEPGAITTTTKDTTITTEESTTTTITDKQTESTTESVEISTELSTETTVPTTEQQPEAPAVCPPGFIGNVPHPERCDSYFLCSGWEPIQLFCAPGLEFDMALQTCVAIAEGGCNWQNGQLTSTTAEPSTDGDLTTTEFTSEVSTITDEQTVSTTESQTATEVTVTETTEGTTDDLTTITKDLTTTEEPGTITTTTKDTTITTEESTTTITDKQTESTTESLEISTELSTETTVTTTEQQPETPAICPPGFVGNVPHPERCDSYFLCSGWEPIQLFCAPGLEFDAALQTCVAIAEGGCNWQNGQLTSTTAEPSTDGDLTTTEFTSEVSTITTDEQTVATTESQTATEVLVTETTITTITEDLTTTTEKPGTITTTTKDTTITTEESTTITNEQTESTTEFVVTSTELSTEKTVTTTEQQPETPAICPPGFVGNVPHPERCDSYFLCSGWEPIQLFCAPGLEFDIALQTCVAIAEGGCNWQNGQLTSTTAEPSTEGDLTTTEFTSEVSTTTDEQTVSTTESQTATEVTVTETTEGTTDDITTITENLTTTTEEPGTITTTTKDTTITTEESTTTITDKQTESTTESVEISTELSTETTVPTTEQQPETPAICPPGFVGNVPHPERCDSYFLCSGWEPIQLFCAPGLEFDAALQTCVAIAEGGCNWQNGQLTSTTAEPSTDGDLTTTEFTSEVSTTTTDEQTVSTTESETTTTDPTEQTVEESTATAEGGITTKTTDELTSTTEEQTATTSNSPTTVELTTVTEELEAEPLCPEGFIGSVPHPDRCDSYYMCTGWTPIQLFCLPGQEFDPVLSQCVVIAEDGCTSRLTNEVVNKQETRSQIHKGDVDRNDLNRKADGSRATAEFANRIARTELCPLGFEGRIATPEGKSFYLCSGGNAIELLCSVESKFDPLTGKCIYNYEKRMRS